MMNGREIENSGAVEPRLTGRDYLERGLVEARKRGLTAEAVRVMSYTQVAELCAVTISAKGESPMAFHYANVREYVGKWLADDVRMAALEQERQRLQTKLRELSDQRDTEVVLDSEGVLRIVTKTSIEVRELR